MLNPGFDILERERERAPKFWHSVSLRFVCFQVAGFGWCLFMAYLILANPNQPEKPRGSSEIAFGLNPPFEGLGGKFFGKGNMHSSPNVGGKWSD